MRRRAARRLLGVAAVSVGGHGLILWALLGARATLPVAVEPPPMQVALVAPPAVVVPPPPPPPPPVVAEPKTPDPPPKPRLRLARPTPPRPDTVPLPAGQAVVLADGAADVSEAQLVGAGTAESGGGAGACNMVRRLQTALRRSPLVQAAVADTPRGKPIMIWNGDWVRHGGQEGAGLAAVREAIMWEVGFAPKACRSEAVRGLVVVSMADGPGAPRLVVGSGQWRWSDVLFARGAPHRQ